MRLNIYQPLLLAVGANIALSTHWNYWNHAHGKLLHHAQQLEPRGDLLELNGDQIPADLVELRYTTTTLYQDCLPTSTAFITVTICEDEPSAPTQSLPQFPTNVVQAQPPPEETTVVHSTRTRTITVTEPSTETITLISQHHSTSTAIPADAPSPPAVIPFQHVPNVAFTQAVTPTHLSTTITTSIPGLGSATVSVAADVGDAPSGSAFVGDRPVPAPTKVEQGPGLLPTLPHLPQLLPTTVIPNLPIPSLDQVFHPANPSIPSDLQWTSLPKDGAFSTKGFGGRSIPHGNRIKYEGNVGIPWGSNIISVSPTEAHRYKYVAQFTGSNDQPWTVVIWNKVGPDGKMDGWYGHSALQFVLAPGETRYVAFDEDSEGAWSAAPGTKGVPRDQWGGYISTWGEFSFGDQENDGWSGWDVSAIQTQIAHGPVEGMRICMADGKGCSIITPGAERVVDAYTAAKRHHDGIGGAASPGPVRLTVDLDYKE